MDVYFFDCDKTLYDYDFHKRLPKLAELGGVSQYRLASSWWAGGHERAAEIGEYATSEEYLEAFAEVTGARLTLAQWQEDQTKAVQLERVLRVQDKRLQTLAERITLERLIDKMAPGYRSTLLLHDFHGYEHEEICEIMSVRQGTSKSQLHKGRKRLRAMLEAA